ncbi:MAG: hypothetical protein K2N04_05855 [Alistipes sp.]|nr:hypothetical protein [Alistipes sp.]
MNDYGSDLDFLTAHGIATIELTDSSGDARVCLAPAWQGRVMTSTAAGRSGSSFGWLNRPLIASGAVRPQFNPVGGEERFWLGPEGGPFSLYFAPGAEQTYARWQVPAALDTEPFETAERTARHVRFTHRAVFRNASGTRLDVGIDRRVTLLQPEETDMEWPAEVRAVGYRSENRIANRGAEAWTPQGGAPSIWMLGMFPPSPATTVFLPYDSTARGKIVNSDYFGALPADRLAVGDGLVCLRIDGAFRSKIGLPCGRDRGICGSYDAASRTLTLIAYPRSQPDSRYVESRWGEQSDPFGGDVVNAYNDGPTETGEVMGPFFEIETSSPAAFLHPGGELCHTQEVFHLQGPEPALAEIARELLSADLEKIKNSFNC